MTPPRPPATSTKLRNSPTGIPTITPPPPNPQLRTSRNPRDCAAPDAPMTRAPPQIGYDDFLGGDVRVGRIVQVDDFPKAKKPASRLRIDFGELGVKPSSVHLTRHSRKEDLARRLVLAGVNFPPRQ